MLVSTTDIRKDNILRYSVSKFIDISVRIGVTNCVVGITCLQKYLPNALFACNKIFDRLNYSTHRKT